MANNAPRDENRIPTLLGASSADGISTVTVYANPTTHRLLVDLGAGVTGPGLSTDNAIVRWDGTTGVTIQDSAITIADTTGVITVAAKNYTWPGQTGTFSTVTTGADVPASTPAALGQIYVDTGHTKVYISTGTSSSADWTLMN